MARLRAKILDVILGDVVGIGAKRGQQQSGFLRLEGEWIHFDEVEDVLSAGLGGEIVVDPGEQGVAAELPGIAATFEADGVG